MDFRKKMPHEELADQAKALLDQNFLIKEIAKKLSESEGRTVSRNCVTKALASWFERRGLPAPDGRSRRATLERKGINPFLYQAISEQVMELCEQKMHYGEIAEKLGIDRNTLTSSVRYWHEKRGLPVPDGRGRRKTLPRRPTASDVTEEVDSE